MHSLLGKLRPLVACFVHNTGVAVNKPAAHLFSQDSKLLIGIPEGGVGADLESGFCPQWRVGEIWIDGVICHHIHLGVRQMLPEYPKNGFIIFQQVILPEFSVGARGNVVGADVDEYLGRLQIQQNRVDVGQKFICGCAANAPVVKDFVDSHAQGDFLNGELLHQR